MENLKRQRWYAPKSREGALPGLERRCYIIRRKYREGGKRGEGRGEMGERRWGMKYFFLSRTIFQSQPNDFSISAKRFFVLRRMK